MRVLAVGWMLVAVGLLPLTAVEFHVAPGGTDNAIGTAEQPFGSLEAARTAVRARLTAGTPEPITVWIAGGTYVRNRSFVLEASDSGTAAAPVVWRGRAAQPARIVLSREVPVQAAVVVDDAPTLARLDPVARGKVVRIDLAALGVRPSPPLAKLFTGSGGLPQVVFADQPLPLARWPNDGYSTMERVLAGGANAAAGKPGGVFVYRGERPQRWVDAAKRGELWVAGFWRVPWVVQSVQVQAIDPALRTISLNAPVPGGIGSKYSKEVDGTRQGDGKEPWYVLNLLEELDRPGEWCVDTATQTLYLWPPTALTAGALRVDDQPEPVIHLKGATQVQLRGLSISGGLAEGIRVDGGAEVVIAGCTIQDVGGAGIRIEGGQRQSVRGCDLRGCGAEGIIVSAGERKTLTSGGCTVLNNHLHHYGRISPMVSGIVLHGVGTRVANNLLHDAPYGGVLYHGNDHVMELNEIHNLGLDGGDLGAFYANGDWASRGNVMRHNLVHHARQANAFYMDDGHSGDVIEANLVFDAACGPFIGGGHHHQVRDNLIIASAKGIHVDDRGVARKYDRQSNHLMKPLEKMPWQQEPWTTRYPELAAMFAEDRLTLPTGNRLIGNVLVACAKPVNLGMRKEHQALIELVDHTIVAKMPAFADANRLDFRLQGESPAVAALLARIPWQRIGLQIDEDRPTLPDAASTGRYEHRAGRRVFDSETDLKRTDEDQRR